MARLLLLLALFVSGVEAAPLICTGDSQSAERLPMVTAAQTYCALLAGRRGSSYQNFSVAGANTTDWFYGQVPKAVSQSPSCVAVMIGINDGWIDPSSAQPWPAGSLTPSQTIGNMEAGLNLLLNAGHQVTVFTNFAMWWAVNLATLPDYIRAEKTAASFMKVPVIDAYALAANCWLSVAGEALYSACAAWYGAGSGFTPDWSHPYAAGQVAIADLCSLPQNANDCACKP